MNSTLVGLDKETILKARKRIKSQFLKGKKQPRVVLEKNSKNGVYRFKHHVHEVPFKLDSLGRAYFSK